MKEYTSSGFLIDSVADDTADVTIPVFSNGTATVSYKDNTSHDSTLYPRIEFLRGGSATDECKPLFQQYKACLTVG